MFLTKAFLTFSMIFLIATNTVFTASIENVSTPPQASQALHHLAGTYGYHADRHESLSHYDGNVEYRPMRKVFAKEYANKASEARQKAHKVDRLDKQLSTNTVAGKATHPQARTRSQAKRMAAPY